MKPFTVGSLFAGIGGFDLGFERAGFETVWQVEIDPWCRKVLAKNFPRAERYGDIKECGSHNLKRVDVIVGGFPCQDISNAGLRAGIEGERSGLWSEFARIISELRPSFVLVENVAALLGRGMGRVLGDLAALGYDAEWEIVSAADVGAPHLRERVWALAYPASGQDRRLQQSRVFSGIGASSDAGNSQTFGCNGKRQGWTPEQGQAGGSGCELAHAISIRQPRPGEPIAPSDTAANSSGETGDAVDVRIGDFWAVEPDVGRVAHGIPKRVDRLRGLGNAVIPQIPELYAHRIRAILEQEQA